MSSVKKPIPIADADVVNRLAYELAVETFHNAEYNKDGNFLNILTDEWINRVNFVALIDIYTNLLKAQIGQTVQIPVVFVPYPYYNFTDQSHKDEKNKILSKLIIDDFRTFQQQDEFSENDMKLQSLLMLRQYLRMLRRLKGLTHFYSNKNEEVTTFTDGKLYYKFPVKNLTTLDRIANSMYYAGYELHPQQWDMKNVNSA